MKLKKRKKVGFRAARIERKAGEKKNEIGLTLGIHTKELGGKGAQTHTQTARGKQESGDSN